MTTTTIANPLSIPPPIKFGIYFPPYVPDEDRAFLYGAIVKSLQSRGIDHVIDEIHPEPLAPPPKYPGSKRALFTLYFETGASPERANETTKCVTDYLTSKGMPAQPSTLREI